jgi:hypothetical protein
LLGTKELAFVPPRLDAQSSEFLAADDDREVGMVEDALMTSHRGEYVVFWGSTLYLQLDTCYNKEDDL